ncbi:YopX family protein [Enterococcus bulliens]
MVPRFRAFLIEEKTMRDVVDIDFVRNMYCLQVGGATIGEWFWYRDLFLMQSTGLKDKNGVEIYEGDVVEAEITLGHTDIGVVKFERGEFKVDDETEDILSFGFYYKFEVIGNIWEDPELLEEE